jgi:L-alanine-DL-glutamate epimerase-like enolase superfamily enzyme
MPSSLSVRGACTMPDVRAPVESLQCRSFKVPTDHPEADGTLAWDATTVVVVQARAGGQAGLGWTYAARACESIVGDQLEGAVVGHEALDVPSRHEAMVRACRNLGRPGVVSCAISAVDVALWDCKARLLDVPLYELWGRSDQTCPVYGSGGFTTYDERMTADQLEHWTSALGIPRVKIKIGESWGTCEDRDLSRALLARRMIGDDTALYVDANGAYTAKQAVRLGRQLEQEAGVVWFEEPVSSDDLAGLHRVRQQLSLDVAAGEYGYDEPYFARMLAAGAVDCLQVDVTRCGGYTEWLRIAALARASGFEVSGHCAPNLHAHVGLCVPNLRHVEYFWDHERVDRLLFDGVLTPSGGVLRPDPGSPGHGMTLKERDAARFEV